MIHRTAPRDARRGGLFILAAGCEGPRLADAFAESGYETVSLDRDDEEQPLFAPPVFVLAYPACAIDVWTSSGSAAISVIADEESGAFVDRPPRSPAALHLTPRAHDRFAEEFAAAQPDLAVHRLEPGADGERLLVLRTLRLFAMNTGGREHGAPD